MVRWRDERGFSLAELLVAFAVLALVLATATAIHRSVLQAYVTGSNQAEVQQNARIVLERMAREIRQSSSALTLATSTSITFIDQDTVAAVTYLLTGSAPNFTLTRRTANGDAPLIGNVKSLTFAYWDDDSPPNALAAPVGTPANVRRIDITVQTGSEDLVVAGGVADTKAELTTSVRLRNL